MYELTSLTVVQSSSIIQRPKTNGNIANVNSDSSSDTVHAITWILQGIPGIQVAVYCWIIGNPVPTVRWKSAAELTPSTPSTPSTPRIRCRPGDPSYSAKPSRKCGSETRNDRNFLGSTLSLAISPLKGSRFRWVLGFLSDHSLLRIVFYCPRVSWMKPKLYVDSSESNTNPTALSTSLDKSPYSK